MNKLNIIIVGYNEEKNIPKMLKYLHNLTSKLDNLEIFYIDQESSDNSVELMRKEGVKVYVHKNRGYADPDKKRAIETLCKGDDWCLILDCDEEITENLADEIYNSINSEKFDIYNINVEIIGLGGVNNICRQQRLFKKSAMRITEEIHNYWHAKSDKIGNIKSSLVNNDKKERYHELRTMVDKANIYSEKELDKLDLPYWKAVFCLFRKPILRFRGYMIRNKQIKRGIIGIITSKHYAHYQFLIYAKYIEKLKSKNFKTYKE